MLHFLLKCGEKHIFPLVYLIPLLLDLIDEEKKIQYELFVGIKMKFLYLA